MKKYWKAIVIGILALAMGIIIYHAFTQKEKPFNKVDMKTSNYIVNITGRAYLDTIVVTGLKYYGIDSTQILIRDLPLIYNQNRQDDRILKAFILNQGNQYMIYIMKADKEESIHILAHELIHFKQYHDKRLSIVNNEYFLWYGTKYTNQSDYESRPWEAEAFGMGEVMEIVLKQQLYGNKD